MEKGKTCILLLVCDPVTERAAGIRKTDHSNERTGRSVHRSSW